ncbi:ATP-binding protein [Rivihabitans pingtungensis]|jgi:protein-histidine pros-kinase|uniref:ATP-binding protein n=1 Tax=Rivihabitans pingtungensis TaxID=1054498 RepID=UPI0023F0424A|nr:ATP-binding protein [Rivihabitans pingtungensis]
MRLLRPRSLFARLAWLLVAAVAVALAVSTWLMHRDRGEQYLRNRAEFNAHRLVELANWFDTLSPAERERLAPLVSLPGLGIRLAREDAPPEALRLLPPPGIWLEQALRDADLRREVRLSFGRSHHDDDEHGGRRLQAWLHLADGSWMVAKVRLTPGGHMPPPPPFVGQLVATLAAVLLVALVAARSMTRPLAKLADAADALGRDLRRPPLDLRGPQEVERVAQAFNGMQSHLLEHLDTRIKLLAAMSHDLKTPITRLKLRAEMLDDDAMREKFVRDLDEMQALVQETLAYLRDELSGVSLELCDVNSLLDAWLADRAELGQHPLRHGAAERPLATAPAALRRIVDNLLDNAYRYGQGDVELNIVDRADSLSLRVRDHGPGIAPEQLEQVFEPFYRLESSRNRSSGGSGLGLTIARHLAHQLGGQLTLENAADGGLCATLTLPRR